MLIYVLSMAAFMLQWHELSCCNKNHMASKVIIEKVDPWGDYSQTYLIWLYPKTSFILHFPTDFRISF